MNEFCLVCRGALCEDDLFMEREFPGYGRAFHLYRCRSCGCVQTIPMPDMESLTAHEYTDDYGAYGNRMSRSASITARKRLSLLLKHADSSATQPGAALLDVGCSTGWFLKAAQERGFRVAGIELSAYAAAEANRWLGASRVQGIAFEKAVFTAEQFDVIYSNQVIEHVPDPNGFVAKAAKCLKPNGLLVLGTPNVESIAARKMGGAWGSFRKPDHLVFFTPRSLALLMERHGIELRHVHWTGMPALGRHAHRARVDNNLNDENKRCKERGGRTTPVQKAKRFILENPWLSSCATAAIHAFKLGDTLLAMGRKRPATDTREARIP